MAAPATLSSNTPVPPPAPKGAPATMAPPRLRPKPVKPPPPVPAPPSADRLEESARHALRGLAIIVGLGLVYLISDRVVATVTRWPATIQEAVAPSHCTQFIDLAKTAYGENWKVRLDPRDVTCDQEVKAEWERQKLTRYTPPPEPLFAPAPVVAPVVPVQTAAGRSGPATVCLNVVSLAKAKYGEEWRSKLEGADRVCAGETAAPVSQVVSQTGSTP